MRKNKSRNRSPLYFSFIFLLLGSFLITSCSDNDESKSSFIKIFPLAESSMTDEQKTLIADYKEADDSIPNLYATLVRNTTMFQGWSEFEKHVMADSTLTDRARELIILRIAWLCNSEYLYGLHADDAETAGLTDEDILLILEGPGAAGLDAIDDTLLQAVEELYYDAFITDSTWTDLSSYSEEELIDIIFTVGEAMMEAWAINSINIQMDEGLQGFPESAVWDVTPKTIYTSGSSRTRLSTPRMDPLVVDDMADGYLKTLLLAIRAESYNVDLNIFTTLARNPDILFSWQDFTSYMLDSSLEAKDRELIMLRIGWLDYSEYEFGQHTLIATMPGAEGEALWTSEDIIRIIEGPDADGFSSSLYTTLLTAVDELYVNDAISSSTWDKIDKSYDEDELIDMVFSIAQYNLVSMALNSLGIQIETELEALIPGFPEGY